MRVRLMLLMFCSLTLIDLSAQYKIKSVSQVKKAIEVINKDRNLSKKIFSVCNKLTKNDSGSSFLHNNGNVITCYYNNNELQKVIVADTSYFKALYGFHRVEYFFNNGELMYAHESEMNSSRMGACGDVNVDYYYYFIKKQLAKAEITNTSQWAYRCYYGVNSTYKPAEKIYKELEVMMRCIDK